MNWFANIMGKNKPMHNDEIILCPRCKIKMSKKTRLGVTIDKCEKCNGIWLDGGEIDNILLKVDEERKKFEERQKSNKKGKARKD